ncbi:MAG: hypothetical protein EXR69_05585 [Myxococcales bacterium]|nr:hypothetical protein [Myxococcales bacterium]
MPTNTDCTPAESRLIRCCDDPALPDRVRAVALRDLVSPAQVRLGAVLSRLGPTLSRLARNDDALVREPALRTIAMIAEAVRPARSTWAGADVRAWLVTDGINTLATALTDASPRVRQPAAAAIADFAHHAGLTRQWCRTPVLPHLLTQLEDDDPGAALAAVSAIGSLATHSGLRADFIALDGLRALLDAARSPHHGAAALRALLPFCSGPRKQTDSNSSLPVEEWARRLLDKDLPDAVYAVSWANPGLQDAMRDLHVMERLCDAALGDDPEAVLAGLVCLAALLKDNHPDVERLGGTPLAARLMEKARPTGDEESEPIEKAAWALLCRLRSDPTPDEVDAWADEHARTFTTAAVLKLSAFTIDWATLHGSFCLSVDGRRCRQRFALFAGEGLAVKACPPMFNSPMGVPCSYGAVELPDAAYWALQAAVGDLFPVLLPFGARTSTGDVVDRDTRISERIEDQPRWQAVRRELGRRGFRLTVQVRGDEVDPASV